MTGEKFIEALLPMLYLLCVIGCIALMVLVVAYAVHLIRKLFP